VKARGVLDRHDVFALTSGIAEFTDGRRGVLDEAGAKGGSDQARATTRAPLRGPTLVS